MVSRLIIPKLRRHLLRFPSAFRSLIILRIMECSYRYILLQATVLQRSTQTKNKSPMKKALRLTKKDFKTKSTKDDVNREKIINSDSFLLHNGASQLVPPLYSYSRVDNRFTVGRSHRNVVAGDIQSPKTVCQSGFGRFRIKEPRKDFKVKYDYLVRTLFRKMLQFFVAVTLVIDPKTDVFL